MVSGLPDVLYLDKGKGIVKGKILLPVAMSNA